MTLQELLDQIAEVHADSGRSANSIPVEVYDTVGRPHELVEVYVEDGVLCFDVEKV